MGKRNNTVDLGKGNSASGELGYMRGEEGQGTGATNFKPGSAFTGAKYRASGGETAGFMVGEQGPEMFIPDRSGRIAPADETAARATTSNVNFNISAVDAAGVEDVLVRQKGHIIRMIREAANEHGQPFLEDISDGSYTSIMAITYQNTLPDPNYQVGNDGSTTGSNGPGFASVSLTSTSPIMKTRTNSGRMVARAIKSHLWSIQYFLQPHDSCRIRTCI